MSLSKEEKLQFVKMADKSLLHWAKAFHAKSFWRPFSPYIHGTLVRFMDAPVDFTKDVSERCKQGAAPRGIGKSSLFNTVNLVRRTCMKRFNYAYLASHTIDQAVEHLEAIKWQFENNPKIDEIFGDMRGPVWRSDVLTFKNGVKIRAMGANSQARGRRNFDMSRPDFGLGDDMEDNESADSPTQTAKLMRFWLADIVGSLNPDTGWAQLWGTFLSGGCMLAQLCEANPDNSVIVELFDDNYKSKYPEVYSDEWIEQKRLKALREGKLDILWAEYRNKPIALENQIFRASMFKEWKAEEIKRDELVVVLIGDPGHTNKPEADGSAIHVVGFAENGDIFDLEYVNVRATNGDFYAEVARLVKAWDIVDVYIDAVGVKDYILVPLRQYLANEGLYCLVHEVPSKGSKVDRIRGLVPLYSSGKVYHNPNMRHELESQFLQFPKGRYDDLIDCLAYAPFIAQERSIGFTPQKEEEEGMEKEIDSASRILRMRVV